MTRHPAFAHQPHFGVYLDRTGDRYGAFTVVELYSRRDRKGFWRVRCDAGHMSILSDVWLKKKRDSLVCDRCEEKPKVIKPVVQRIGAPVTPSRHCSICYGMPWRVEGSRCACGLFYTPELPVELKTAEQYGEERMRWPG